MTLAVLSEIHFAANLMINEAPATGQRMGGGV